MKRIGIIVAGSAFPGDLPFKSALSHELMVNLKTARRIGITVPSELLTKTNQVIR